MFLILRNRTTSCGIANFLAFPHLQGTLISSLFLSWNSMNLQLHGSRFGIQNSDHNYRIYQNYCQFPVSKIPELNCLNG